MENSICEYCLEAMPPYKMYVTTLEHADDYHKSLRAHGHKYCMMALKYAYDKHGKVVSKKEIEAIAFDPSI